MFGDFQPLKPNPDEHRPQPVGASPLVHGDLRLRDHVLPAQHAVADDPRDLFGAARLHRITELRERSLLESSLIYGEESTVQALEEPGAKPRRRGLCGRQREVARVHRCDCSPMHQRAAPRAPRNCMPAFVTAPRSSPTAMRSTTASRRPVVSCTWGVGIMYIDRSSYVWSRPRRPLARRVKS